jgi:hypothetical protein
MKMKKEKFVHTTVFGAACLFVATLLAHAGCNIIGVIGTPTSAESKSEAEFNLAAEKNRKILVLVDQPTYLECHPNLRYFITDNVKKLFQQQAKIPDGNFISYDALAEFRSNTPDFSLMAPDKVGSALGADYVLLIAVSKCRLSQIGDTGYIGGNLVAQAQLFRVAGGEKVWPALEPTKIIRVGFESDRRGSDAAAVRLAFAAAHCVTRYLYNCPKNQFKFSDEITDVGWEQLK